MKFKLGNWTISILWGPHGLWGWWFNIFSVSQLDRGFWFYYDRGGK